ncbi:MAG: hypothetical protein HUU16_00980 [Candidatus Omnitrophica bacterium]|nr:hypothetical protein [Candidatus Omnitrophota bacterium]
MNRSLTVAALIAYILSPAWVRNIDPGDYEPEIGYSSEAQSSRNTSAVARLFGEFRTSMSDIMFLKTERYLHSGIAYQPHIQDEKTFNAKDVGTLIRPPDQDWRGFIGDIERSIKPWLDPKTHAQHTRGAELLPWFRLMTLVNPHRIRGYRIGTFILMTSGDADSTRQAREFLMEGIRNNPKSHELQFMVVRLIQHDLMDLQREKPNGSDEKSLALLKEGLEYARRGVEFGAEARPRGGWQGKGRPAEMEDSFIGCMHYEIFFLRRLGRNEEALSRARDLEEKYGPDPILQTEIQELEAELKAPPQGEKASSG